ncbi:tetratricopeptide repeat protein [Halarcobacter sp.]|uniref:tetratricopeptide repeat protein n=1 Tax=Halarcobacter sp. TaxID=2321133 RepID=UPI002AAC12ED|nr:tetratricopeptide repeat protein [Halarcobacter sp.]
MDNKMVYTPQIFEKNDLEDAKKIILTKEGNVSSEERWDKETSFVVDDIISKLNLDENKIILDYGCGIGRIAKELIEKTSCKIIGVDISESMRKLATEYVNSSNFEAISLEEFKNKIEEGKKFDFAYSIWVLQHCIKPQEDIKLIKKSLKDDALIYILNNLKSAVPTNKGWIDNKVNIHSLLIKEFEEKSISKLPIEISSEKISNNTFISLLKNSKYKLISLFQEAHKAYNQNKLEEAKAIYEKILDEDSKNAEAYCNLGFILRKLGKNKEAFDSYIKAINSNPRYGLTYNNLGNLLKDTGNLEAALKVYGDALKINPKDFQIYNNIGMVYEKSRRYNDAIKSYKEAVRINPNYDKAINNIGVVLYKQEKHKEAIEIFKIALKVNPKYYELYSNIGACYNKLKMYDEAIESLNIAIEKNPENGGAYTNLGNVYNKIYDYKKAAKLHEKSIELEPKGENAYSNVGNSYKHLGQTKKAIDSYKKAIELKPDFVNAHFDLATMYLAKGDYKNGFAEYEWRFRKDEMLSHIANNKDIFSKPMFTGKEEIKDKTILLHSEQGFGDSIQFIRFLKPFKEKFSCKIAVKCRDELKELFKAIEEIDILVDRSEDTPEFDYHLPIMSLAKILELKSSKDLPKEFPYLFATKDKELEVKEEKGKLNIGICWSASVTGESYDGKVFSLEYFIPLANNPKINLYSLQVGPENEDIKKYNLEDKIIDLTDKLTDFSKTASLMKELDLVISSDTSVAHLAGALDVPVWIPLQKIPDWRWSNKGDTTPWYKSAKLFRQKTARVWDSVFQSIYDKLFSNFKIKIDR